MAAPRAWPDCCSAPGGAPVSLVGEEVLLLPGRALFWPRRATLLIADVHWSTAATFRATGIPVPGEGVHNDLARLDAQLASSGACRLVVLSDLLHARAGRDPEVLAAVPGWRARHPGLALWLVRSNHDRGAGDPPADWAVRALDARTPLGPFLLAHHPAQSNAGYTLAGHLHPGATLAGPGCQRLRLPCFWLGARCAVLPGDRVFVLAERAVVEVPR